MKVHKVDRNAFLEEVKKADWREDLKHVHPVREITLIMPVSGAEFCFSSLRTRRLLALSLALRWVAQVRVLRCLLRLPSRTGART